MTFIKQVPLTFGESIERENLDRVYYREFIFVSNKKYLDLFEIWEFLISTPSLSFF